jgi:hypothetical protein
VFYRPLVRAGDLQGQSLEGFSSPFISVIPAKAGMMIILMGWPSFASLPWAIFGGIASRGWRCHLSGSVFGNRNSGDIIHEAGD